MPGRRIGIAAPNILNHGTRRNWSVSPFSRFVPGENLPVCNKRRGGPYSRSGRGVSRGNRS